MGRSGEKTVVVVDDEPDIVSSLLQLIELAFPGVRVLGTLSPVEALALAKEGVDLLLTDYRMPVMDGIELARRAQAANHDLTIVIVTAHADPLIQKQAEALGIDVLHKPVEIDGFIAAIQAGLE